MNGGPDGTAEKPGTTSLLLSGLPSRHWTMMARACGMLSASLVSVQRYAYTLSWSEYSVDPHSGHFLPCPLPQSAQYFSPHLRQVCTGK